MVDDRVTCLQCRELAPNGNCRAAMRRERRDVRRDYGSTQPYLAHRCEFYRPKPDDADQRPGKVRYPTLWNDYVKKYGEAA